LALHYADSIALSQPDVAMGGVARQQTRVTYDHWTVRCEMRDQAKSCELTQTIESQGQCHPIAQVAIGGAKNDPLKVVF